MPNPYALGFHVTAADTITVAAASVQIVDFPVRVKLLRWGCLVTTAVVLGTTDAVYTLNSITFDHSTKTALDTLTLDTARAVGHVEYADLHGVAASNNVIQPGEQIEIYRTTAGAGGAIAGAAKFWFTYEILGPLWNATYHHSF